jgi:hypothetical protein
MVVNSIFLPFVPVEPKPLTATINKAAAAAEIPSAYLLTFIVLTPCRKVLLFFRQQAGWAQTRIFAGTY